MFHHAKYLLNKVWNSANRISIIQLHFNCFSKINVLESHWGFIFTFLWVCTYACTCMCVRVEARGQCLVCWPLPLSTWSFKTVSHWIRDSPDLLVQVICRLQGPGWMTAVGSQTCMGKLPGLWSPHAHACSNQSNPLLFKSVIPSICWSDWRKGWIAPCALLIMTQRATAQCLHMLRLLKLPSVKAAVCTNHGSPDQNWWAPLAAYKSSCTKRSLKVKRLS